MHMRMNPSCYKGVAGLSTDSLNVCDISECPFRLLSNFRLRRFNRFSIKEMLWLPFDFSSCTALFEMARVNGDALSRIVSLVDAYQAIGKFEHVVSNFG